MEEKSWQKNNTKVYGVIMEKLLASLKEMQIALENAKEQVDSALEELNKLKAQTVSSQYLEVFDRMMEKLRNDNERNLDSAKNMERLS